MNEKDIRKKIEMETGNALKAFADEVKNTLNFYVCKNEDSGKIINTDDLIDNILAKF